MIRVNSAWGPRGTVRCGTSWCISMPVTCSLLRPPRGSPTARGRELSPLPDEAARMLRLPGKREWRAPRRCPGADPAGAGALGAVAQRDRRPRRRLPEGSAALATRQRPQRFRFTQRASFCRRSILGPPRHLTGPPGARVLPGRRPRGLRPPERRSRPAAACPSPRRPPSGILIAPSGLSSSSQKCHRVPGRARIHRHCQITFRRRQEPFTPHGEAKADGLRGAGQ